MVFMRGPGDVDNSIDERKARTLVLVARIKRQTASRRAVSCARDGSGDMTSPRFCTSFTERVYITAIGCEIGFGGTKGLRAAGAGGLQPSDECGRSVLYTTRHFSITICASFNE